MFKIITIGSISWDVFFKTSQSYFPLKNKNPLICFRYGTKIDPEEAFFSLGGGAANSACSFSRLGLKVAIVSQVGSDPLGKMVLENLQREKVDTRLIKIDRKLSTALSFVIVSAHGERTIFPYAGAAGNLELTKTKKLKAAQWIYLTTLRKKSQRILPQINKLVKQYKIKLAFNPGNTELEKGLNYLKNILKNTEVLLLNKEEAIKLISSYKRVTSRRPQNLLLILKEFGPRIVVITDGEKGSWAKNENSLFYMPAMKTKLVEKTGAGDAFGSGFVAGLIHFGELKKALLLATANAASVISKFGATSGLLNLTQAQRIINKKSYLTKIKEYK